jgi:catechol 2,3-dioxygenase-like lactoylglutathione lyase family enzyme
VSVGRIVPDLHVAEPTAGAAFFADVLGLELVMDHGWIATFAAPANPLAQISVMREDATAPVRPRRLGGGR